MSRPTWKVLGATLALSTAVIIGSAGPARALEPGEGHQFPTVRAFDGVQYRQPTTKTKTVTLPYFDGVGPNGSPVQYIVTESSDATDAGNRGVNYSPKLANSLGKGAVQNVTRAANGTVTFSGTIDFSPQRNVVPGASPNEFPPTTADPGAVGDANYSPLTTTGNGIVTNMPQVANSTGQNDSVVSIDKTKHQVTLTLFGGFYDDHPILYIRTEASDPGIAAVESSTYAPRLGKTPGLGTDDPATSSREAIVPIVNGPRGIKNPVRQGLDSALAGEGAPLNVVQEDPAAPSDDSSRFYSPVWDVTPAVWTNPSQGAITQETSFYDIHSHAEQGELRSYAPFGPPNPELALNPTGAVSLCPIIVVLPIPGCDSHNLCSS